jgi:D-methionine transport system substrate-binding protein
MRTLSCLILILSLVSCNKPSPNTLVIGTIAGPEAELMETAKQVAEKQHGLTIKLVEFNDYNLPNEALDDGSLDANVYQHLPYLKAAVLTHGYDLQAIGRTFVYPMAIYSSTYKSLKDLPEKSIIAVPNDPSNEMRAFLLLEKSGLITLKNTANRGIPTLESNPKKLQFKEMDAAQLPRILPDVAAAVINTTFALPAGLSPSKDALYKEGKESPYANIIVIRRDTKKRPQLDLFVQSLHSEEVTKKAKELFGEAAIPAW